MCEGGFGSAHLITFELTSIEATTATVAAQCNGLTALTVPVDNVNIV